MDDHVLRKLGVGLSAVVLTFALALGGYAAQEKPSGTKSSLTPGEKQMLQRPIGDLKSDDPKTLYDALQGLMGLESKAAGAVDAIAGLLADDRTLPQAFDLTQQNEHESPETQRHGQGDFQGLSQPRAVPPAGSERLVDPLRRNGRRGEEKPARYLEGAVPGVDLAGATVSNLSSFGFTSTQMSL